MLSFLNAKSISGKKNISSTIQKGDRKEYLTTDFVIYTNQNDILLVEIEKPSTKLFTQKGQPHNEIIHAIDQVNDWLNEVKENKVSIINSFGIENIRSDNVGDVKGVVIAGQRDNKFPQQNTKLNRNQNIDFYTYDDLLEYLKNSLSKK